MYTRNIFQQNLNSMKIWPLIRPLRRSPLGAENQMGWEAWKERMLSPYPRRDRKLWRKGRIGNREESSQSYIWSLDRWNEAKFCPSISLFFADQLNECRICTSPCLNTKFYTRVGSTFVYTPLKFYCNLVRSCAFLVTYSAPLELQHPSRRAHQSPLLVRTNWR